MANGQAIPQVLVAAVGGAVIGIDPTTGDEQWRHDIGEAGVVELSLQEGVLLAASEGQLHCIEYPTGRLLSSMKLRSRARATMLVQGNRVFVGVSGSVTCYTLEGERVWHRLVRDGGSSVALGFPGNVRQADQQ